MTIIKYILPILLLCIGINVFAQNTSITGTISGKQENGSITPLPGANIVWAGTTKGTVTDIDGKFSLQRIPKNNKLVISFIGYQTDTIDVIGKNSIAWELKSGSQLDVFEVEGKIRSTSLQYMNPIHTQVMNKDELQKAACCNLSESFETNPSVDVSFTDAVTGTRQIQMLGLAGPYTQITREVMPDVRGLSSIQGLEYVPGPWVESIQLSKGAGSVVQGYESIAGQINYELKKPDDEKLFLNGYLNQGGRAELNLTTAQKVSEKFSTTTLLHGKYNSLKFDNNNDGFLDNPLNTTLIGINRWQYNSGKGYFAQAGIKGTYLDLQGGQETFNPKTDKGTTNSWGFGMNTQRIEGWAKTGYVFPNKENKSIGLQTSVVSHEQNGYFGLRKYNGKQQNFYSNLIFMNQLANEAHSYKVGASYLLDNYNETFDSLNTGRTESVPGVYGEYTYSPGEEFSLVAGIRADYHNLYGLFYTPRLHARYAPTERTVFRASAGRGQRVANIFADNMGLMASNRSFIIVNETNALQPEVAWNYGLTFSQNFTLDFREGSLVLDFFRTDFENQIIVDVDHSPQQVLFYNLSGNSFSNSFQAEVNYELIRRLDVRLAYRWYDVQTDYTRGTLRKPLLSTHRAFANLEYETKNQWKFDYTVQWQGSKRLPYTASNPTEFQLASESPNLVLMNAQVTKKFGLRWAAYLGMENITNFRQPNAIVATNEPFGNYFDASMIWAPVFGRMTYVGFRFTIK